MADPDPGESLFRTLRTVMDIMRRPYDGKLIWWRHDAFRSSCFMIAKMFLFGCRNCMAPSE